LRSNFLSEIRKTIGLAIPVIIGNIGQTLISVTDNIMVGKLGANALGATGFSGGIFCFLFYTNDEIGIILACSVGILGIEVPDDAVKEIAIRSRSTPRTANYLLKRCRDFAQVEGTPLSKETVHKALAMLEVDELGLTQSDRDLLTVLIDKFNGGPVGLKTLAAALSEDEGTVEEVHEPYLMQLGLLERTSRGRVATPAAYEHLGFETPRGAQEKLI
jgi:Holliday junction DNA helicase RuvB